MKQLARISLVFLLLCTPLLADNAGVSLPRLYPQELALKIKQHEGNLSLASFLQAAFRFSGTAEEDLGQMQHRLNRFIEQVQGKLPADSSSRDKAELILTIMHKDLLTVYRERQTRIDVLLETGYYNCVSSAVLYAALVKSIGLEVAGVRTSDHAFCLVRADGRSFDVETTSPFGFDPGTKREFTDHFGKVTGYSYVPPGNYRDRNIINEKQLLSLILYNRSAFSSETKEYQAAVGPAVDAFTLLGDEESFDRMIVSILNLASWYGFQADYQAGLTFLNQALDLHPQDSRLIKLRQDLLHNWAIALIEQNKLEKAKTLLEEQRRLGQVEQGEWESLMIYIYQVEAQTISREDFQAAALTIREALEKIGKNEKLLKSFEVYSHNQFVFLANSGSYRQALLLVEEALATFPASTVLARDRELLRQQLFKKD